ncbi:hypothetical protein OEG84_10690 [Hoeflea sp. G2-23]|uniref:Uncharacterized protein n=1 Tax=Hoeflea algicola TaxID=2983763 RepID=A0ABT3Z8R3_9HYPH|nr:hypothetical protein [Hoeflea algicola]MCY0148167.1 hypothetical protein [Hoeflea algicola]
MLVRKLSGYRLHFTDCRARRWIFKECSTRMLQRTRLPPAFRQRPATEHGPIGHGYASEYRQICAELLQFFQQWGQGETRRAPQSLSPRFGDAEVVVTTHEEIESGHNTVFCCIRTERKTSTAVTALDAAAFQIAADGRNRPKRQLT